MLHPSYSDLVNAINSDQENDADTGCSRYSVVMAISKRARQIIDGDDSLAEGTVLSDKPLSVAVEELNQGQIKILNNEETDAEPEY
ncbi:MAG: DNA-directed RNA polymerase subunit omega [Lachnospiraceae bacterium]|nr:DNA-directed RNA polymerase subunit omega [Lachnospiraceae bacterium]